MRITLQNGRPTYERKLLSPEYEEFLKSNTLPEANFRFHKKILNIFLNFSDLHLLVKKFFLILHPQKVS